MQRVSLAGTLVLISLLISLYALHTPSWVFVKVHVHESDSITKVHVGLNWLCIKSSVNDATVEEKCEPLREKDDNGSETDLYKAAQATKITLGIAAFLAFVTVLSILHNLKTVVTMALAAVHLVATTVSWILFSSMYFSSGEYKDRLGSFPNEHERQTPWIGFYLVVATTVFSGLGFFMIYMHQAIANASEKVTPDGVAPGESEHECDSDEYSV